ncbi:MAG: histidine kinase dimerization/phospho-acceptor domain-containing protein, partial [bacterium]
MNIFYLAGFLTAITSGFLGVIVFLHDIKSSLNRSWAFFCFAVMMWGVWCAVVFKMPNHAQALFWGRIIYNGAVPFIPTTFLHFVFVFLGMYDEKKIYIHLCYALSLFFVFINVFFPPYLIKDLVWVFDSFYYITPGVFFHLLFLYFSIAVVGGLLLLIKGYKNLKGQRKAQAKYLFAGMSIGFGGGTTAFFVLYGIQWNPGYGNMLIPLYPLIMSYALVKYQFFTVQVAFVDMLVAAVWSLMTFRLFVLRGENIPLYLDIFLFMAIFVVGVIMILLVLRDARRRLQLADLNEHLEDKVREQTKEIRRAYEVEKKARHDLEALDIAKTDFILTTQHHLRTPLTVIKGMLSMLQGKSTTLDEEQKKFLNKADENTNKLVL